ncbi:MAG: hypothetical protein NT069_32485, partial [Planctomycetota bacterium]|nr:hypothetical protein [Planctomycetota bacterium]
AMPESGPNNEVDFALMFSGAVFLFTSKDQFGHTALRGDRLPMLESIQSESERSAVDQILQRGGSVCVRDEHAIAARMLFDVPKSDFDYYDDRPLPTDDDLRPLRNLPHLYSLELLANCFSDEGLALLSELQNLRVLRLSVNGVGRRYDSAAIELSGPIRGDGLRHISKMQSLEDLGLSDTEVDNSSLRHLIVLKRLRSIDMWNTRISVTGLTADGASSLSEIPALKDVYIEHRAVSSKVATMLRRNRPEIDFHFEDGQTIAPEK